MLELDELLELEEEELVDVPELVEELELPPSALIEYSSIFGPPTEVFAVRRMVFEPAFKETG